MDIVPGRLAPLEVSRGIDRAAQQLRRELEKGGSALLVDETHAASFTFRELTHEFGVAMAGGWSRQYLEIPAAEVQSVEVAGDNGLEARHLTDALQRISESSRRIVLVVNPADDSRAMTEASDLGATVFAFPRHRTSLPRGTGTIVPWRRAIDLVPLLGAVRPSDHEFWTRQYLDRSWRPLHANATPLRRVPGVSLGRTHEVIDVRQFEPAHLGARRRLTSHRGGRLTLTSFALTVGSARVFEKLAIGVNTLDDEDEWVVGGKMIRPDRALQITRTDTPGEFNVQLVWVGPDPRPADLAMLENEVTQGLNPPAA